MKKLNVCLISLKVYPDSSDGEAVVIREYYNYLKKRGHNVLLLTGKWTKELKDPNILQFNLVRKKFLWVPHFNIKVIKFLRKHDFDIIHGNGPKGSFPIILANKKNCISTIHDLGAFETKIPIVPLEQLLIKFVAKRVPGLTTVSETVKKEFKYYLPDVTNEKIEVLYNGVSDRYKPFPKKAKRLKNKLKLKSPILLYIGRIAPNKGIKDIIDAFQIIQKNMSNINLLVGGKPDFSMKKQYKIWKSKHKEINFLGLVPEEEMPIYYSMADIFVTYSYTSEGFGLTPIEAMSCGTPVVCSSLKVYKEILEDNAVFVPPKSPELLAKKIIKLLQNENKRQKLIKKSQEFVKKYNWDNVGEKLEEVYYNFLKK